MKSEKLQLTLSWEKVIKQSKQIHNDKYRVQAQGR